MSHTPLQVNIGFIGAGSMAEAILRGLVAPGIADPDRVFALNRQNDERLAELRNKYGIRTTRMPEERDRLISEADILVLGMKPKDAAAGIADIRHLLHPGQLIVSLVAGFSIGAMERIVGGAQPIVRTMPNTSSTIGLGATGISFSSAVTADQKETCLTLFRAIGEVTVIGEESFDILTGVSGSGPAYLYYVMEAMINAGVEGGLSEEAARLLTAQTVLGAAQMVKTTNEWPGELRRKVTSPNGTTQAAIEVLESGHVGDTVARAVKRAAERSREISDSLAEQAEQYGKQV
ncbi:MAG: pyrroline-5-carboxylate reductase [Paenibacillus sp.]|jgi:pyrroline-5-carboxylate reductase|nr:pyrroline-5-carboxylate reductase [Paenibacillus sp.]